MSQHASSEVKLKRPAEFLKVSIIKQIVAYGFYISCRGIDDALISRSYLSLELSPLGSAYFCPSRSGKSIPRDGTFIHDAAELIDTNETTRSCRGLEVKQFRLLKSGTSTYPD